jgi:hypothetical protein
MEDESGKRSGESLKDRIRAKLRRLENGDEPFEQRKSPARVEDPAPEAKKDLERLYYDRKTGFGSVAKVYRRAKEIAPGITYKQVGGWVGKQDVAIRNAPSRKPKVWNSIYAPYPGCTYQMDLMHYNRYAYKGYDWVLNVVDVYSRLAGAVALRSVKGESGKGKIRGEKYLEAYKEIVEKQFNGKQPANLSLDREFIYIPFVQYCESRGTKLHYSQVGQFNKNAIVERFNGTLAHLIQEWRTDHDANTHFKADWVTALPDILHNYNTRYHATIKAVPQEVWDGQDRNHQEIVRLFDHLKEGDRVKRKVFLKQFAKGDELRYSKETYTLTRKVGNRWELKDEDTGEIYTESDGVTPNLFKEDQLKRVSEILTRPSPAEAEAEYRQEQREEKGEGFIDQAQEATQEEKGNVVDEARRPVKRVSSDRLALQEAQSERLKPAVKRKLRRRLRENPPAK